MPFWVWFLIQLTLCLIGLAVLGMIAWDLLYKFKKMAMESQKLQVALAELQDELENSPRYSKPNDNLQDNPTDLTRIWLARKSRHEQDKSAKQRRLIARFSKRK